MEGINIKQKLIIKIATTSLLVALFSILTGLIIELFPFKETHIVLEDNVPQLLPDVISAVVYKERDSWQVLSPGLSEALAAGETIETDYGGIARYNSQISIAYGSVYCDNKEYEYYLLMRKIPLSGRYIFREGNVSVSGDKELNMSFSGQPYYYFGRTHITVNGIDKTASGSINPNFESIICCAIIVFGISFGHYRRQKSSVKKNFDLLGNGSIKEYN